MQNIDHIMPNPRVVPIFWGHEYVVNPKTAKNLQRMISDIVTGPFMNGLAQYGIQRGSVTEPIIIDDRNPPATITYTDSKGQLVDEITKQLIKWIKEDKIVPPPPSDDDINQFYLIVPPLLTQINFFNGAPGTKGPNDPGDPTGNGVQGFHSEDNILPSPPPHYYWAIVKTGDALDGSFKGDLSNAEATDGGLDFLGGTGGIPNGGAFGIAKKICHEFVEQCADRNGSFLELGDNTTKNKCNDTFVNYRGWGVQKYLSVWSNGCSNGDDPVSLKKFLQAINFDFQHKGLRSLGASTINIQFIALTMRGQPAPDTSAL
ncbi:MAG: hypothetical protein QOJ42_3672 [Acidobacteriaceae bacterium]|jgi:hypothetical protein|nr:hypothetical protein [Acidobacteriaceae bacterium]